MSLFGRKKNPDTSGAPEADVDAAVEGADAVLPGDPDPAKRSQLGPWDETETGIPELARIDLGALQLPGVNGLSLRLEVDEDNDQVVAVNLSLGDSSVQLQAFAAPRTEGIWDEIREELLSQVQRSGGTADDVPGHFGREVLARIPSRTASGRTGHQVARFCGIDGPRWFVRAVFSGPAAHDEDQARELEKLIRGTIVVRGADARPPRELLELSLPDTDQSPELDEVAQADQPGMEPPQRGPEIQQIG